MKQILILAVAVVGLSAPAALADCAGHVSAQLPVDKEMTTASITLAKSERTPQSTASETPVILPADDTVQTK